MCAGALIARSRARKAILMVKASYTIPNLGKCDVLILHLKDIAKVTKLIQKTHRQRILQLLKSLFTELGKSTISPFSAQGPGTGILVSKSRPAP